MRNLRFRLEKSDGKRFVFLFLLIVTGITLVLVNTAEAQIRENVRRELEKTDAVIVRAKEAVSESRNPKAENLLEMAVNLQNKAKDAFSMIRYKLAIELTLMARKSAYEAIGFTKRDEENENLVLKAIERTDQIISKAKEVGSELENKRIFSLLEMAINNQQKAKEFFKEHKLKAALKLTLKAREMAQKVLNLANKEKRLDRLAQKELERTDRLIRKASFVVQGSHNQTANRLLEKAKSLHEKAWDLFNQKRFTKAIKNSQRTRELVQKALRLVEEYVTPQIVQNAIQQNQRLIEKVEEKINAGTGPEVKSTFEKGLSHQNKVREYYHEGKFQAALAEAKVANRLITKALEMTQGSGL